MSPTWPSRSSITVVTAVAGAYPSAIRLKSSRWKRPAVSQRALPLLGRQPFLVVNGDIWIDYRLQQLAAYRPAPAESAHLVMVGNPPQHPQGDFCLDEEGWVREREPGATGLTYAGVASIRPVSLPPCAGQDGPAPVAGCGHSPQLPHR